MDDVKIIKANNLASGIYHTQLFSNDPVLQYLKEERGLKEETISKASLGWACKRSTVITSALKSRSLPWEHLATLDGMADFFSERIVIPVKLMGAVRSFTSRSFPTRDPVHLHLRGQKEYLFNEDALLRDDYIFVVESPICCLTLEQNGVNAIAKFGTGVKLVDKIDQDCKIYIVPDIEPSRRGELDAMSLSANLKLEGFKNVRIVLLPGSAAKQDVNSYFLRHNVNDFREVVRGSIYPEDMDPIRVVKNEQPIVYTYRKVLAEMSDKLTRVKSPAQISNDIVSSVDLVTVVGKFTDLIKRGDVFVGNCPLHRETKPSFTVYPAKDNRPQSFYCFGCNRGGDIITFVRDVHGLTYGQALDYIKTHYCD